jgi:hypothetical protein
MKSKTKIRHNVGSKWHLVHQRRMIIKYTRIVVVMGVVVVLRVIILLFLIKYYILLLLLVLNKLILHIKLVVW